MRNTRPILSGQNMACWFLIWSISTNIPTVLANFLGIHNPVFSKKIGRDCGNTSGGDGGGNLGVGNDVVVVVGTADQYRTWCHTSKLFGVGTWIFLLI